MNTEELFKKIVSHAKEYGFIYPSSDLYDGLAAVYDYGPNGVEMKNNIKQYWWKAMTQMHENIVGIDSAIFMHPKIWKASGHVDAFNDPLIDNKDSKKRYRADVLIEDYIAKIEEKINKEITKAQKRFGDKFDKQQFLNTSERCKGYKIEIDTISKRYAQLMQDNDLVGLKNLIDELGIVDPISGTRNWTDVRQFNLMFATKIGSVSDDSDVIYLRPETAQGIFVNYLNVQKTSRMKIPFGIAQIGKAFRNEIVARQFVFRMREFEQMEMEFFCRPGTEMEFFNYWKQERLNWHLSLGIPKEKYRYHDHEKLAHYANAATDIEFEFPFGFKELEGIHSRTDFDLKRHQEFSGKKIQYFDSETNESYTPYCVETSIGLDRMFLAVFSHAFKQETLQDGSSRIVLSLPKQLAPYKVSVLPLVNKDGLPEMAHNVFDSLKYEMSAHYEEKDTIGKRYRRQDAIGTPYCITIDNDSLQDNSVTIRQRDTMQQERVSIDNIKTYLAQH